MNYKLWIGGVRDALGPPPRSFSADTMSYLTPPEPNWLQSNPADLLWGQYYHHEVLFARGEVSWAVVQHASAALFVPDGAVPSPAMLLFSPDPTYDSDPTRLTHLASELAASRTGSSGDPELARYHEIMAAESNRHGKVAVPANLTGGLEVFSIDVIIHPEHLPVPHLAGSIVPVLHHPAAGYAWIVPARFWPDDLVAAWSGLT